MYLTKAQMTQEGMEKAASLDSEGFYQDHQMVWLLFAKDGEDADRPFLFSSMGGGDLQSCFILSETPPDQGQPFFDLQTKEVDPYFKPSQSFRLKTLVNACICTRHPEITDPDKPKRLNVKAYEDLLAEIEGREPKPLQEVYGEWLDKQGEWRGFSVDKVLQVSPPVRMYARKRRRARKMVMDLASVDAIITVTDPESFDMTWREGLGRSKSFGAGLMLLHPITPA